MENSRERYFSTLLLPATDGNTLTVQKNALDRAYILRSFEIEHYWKRATYFWGFQVAIFAAYGFSLNNPTFVTLVLAILGVLTAVANSLSARGSKFWQRNWERHIDMLEDEVEGRLHKVIWLRDGRREYSVSGVNQTLSYCFVIFWLVIVLIAVGDLSGVTQKFILTMVPEGVCRVLLVSIVGLIPLVGGISWLLRQTTNFTGSFPNEVGSHGAEAHWRSRWCRKVRDRDRPNLLLRRAPDKKEKQ